MEFMEGNNDFEGNRGDIGAAGTSGGYGRVNSLSELHMHCIFIDGCIIVEVACIKQVATR